MVFKEEGVFFKKKEKGGGGQADHKLESMDGAEFRRMKEENIVIS